MRPWKTTLPLLIWASLVPSRQMEADWPAEVMAGSSSPLAYVVTTPAGVNLLTVSAPRLAI
jgi:hypothetical protein